MPGAKQANARVLALGIEQDQRLAHLHVLVAWPRRLAMNRAFQTRCLLVVQQLAIDLDLEENVEETVRGERADEAQREGRDVQDAVVQVRLLLDLAQRADGGIQGRPHITQARVEAGKAQGHHLGADLFAAVVIEI